MFKSDVDNFLLGAMTDPGMLRLLDSISYQQTMGQPLQLATHHKKTQVISSTFKPILPDKPVVETRLRLTFVVSLDSTANAIEPTEEVAECAVCRLQALMFVHPKHSKHSFCKTCLEIVIAGDNKCPMCRAPFHTDSTRHESQV